MPELESSPSSQLSNRKLSEIGARAIWQQVVWTDQSASNLTYTLTTNRNSNLTKVGGAAT